MTELLFARRGGTRPLVIPARNLALLTGNRLVEQAHRPWRDNTRPFVGAWSERPRLDIIASSSKTDRAVRTALAIGDIREAVKRAMPSPLDQAHLTVACSGQQENDETEAVYLGALAFVLGRVEQGVKEHQIMGRPEIVFKKVMRALQRYARSRSFWFGYPPPKPAAHTLNLSPELEPALRYTLQGIDIYHMYRHERNKGVVLGVSGCGLGVFIGVGCYIWTVRAYDNGNMACEGFAWDAVKKIYFRTKSEIWYKTPVSRRVVRDGIEVTMPTTPEEKRSTGIANGIQLGLAVFVTGAFKIRDALTINKFYRDLYKANLIMKSIISA